MKIKFDAKQQEVMMNELQWRTNAVELDEECLKEVQGGNAPGDCIVLPPKCGPIYTTLALGEEDGGPIATTLAIGEEDDGAKY
ncbi:hypothetical protein PCURB6_38070 [Paenibacillus curdlanolyticus]|nr:hypothetical protein PCURB6_38070 [Paenibacillus curdlanolyticus]